MQSSNALLREKGYRLTSQRDLILRVLQEAQDHLSIEQITQRVHEYNPRVNMSTVYRNVELLQELRLVSSTCLSGRHIWYEAADEQIHPHFICHHCHKVSHLDPAVLEKLPEQLKRHHQIHHLTLDLTVTGYCEDCWKILSQESNTSFDISTTLPH